MRLDIDTRTMIRFWLVIIGFVAVAGILYLSSHALLILGISFFLALALNIPVTKLAKRLPGKSRVGATALAYIAVVIILGAIIFLVVPPIIQQTAQFIQGLPAVIEGVSSQWAGLGEFVKQYNLQPQVDQAVMSIQESTSSWAKDVGQTVISSIGSVFGFIGSMILVLVLTFFMLVEGPAWMKRIWNLYHDKARMEHHRSVAHRLYGTVTGYVTGQLTVSALGATFAGLAVFVISLIFQMPVNLALPAAAITFLLSLIPMFGAIISATIIGLLLIMNSWAGAITYVIYFIVYQQIENSFIVPHIQSRKIDLTPLGVLGSVTIGFYLFGLLGGIIAIPIAGSVKILLEEYLVLAEKRRKARKQTA